MDFKHVMEAIKLSAQHLYDAEIGFFHKVLDTYNRSGTIAEVHKPHVMELYRKVQLRQADINALLSSLEANSLFLSAEEQAKVVGARMAYEFDNTGLDIQTTAALMALQKSVSERQHNTLPSRGEQVARAPSSDPPGFSAKDAVATLMAAARHRKRGGR